jgi:hypothetical protein
MVVAALLAVGVVLFFGGTFLLDAWWARWRVKGIDERLVVAPVSIADEAQRWLENH